MSKIKKIINLINQYGLLRVLNLFFNLARRRLYYYFDNLFAERDIRDSFNNYSPNMNYHYDNQIFKDNSFKKHKDVIINSANQIINHNFDLLGSGETYLGNEINWSQDFKSGYTWEKKHFSKIKIINLENNSDIKTVWELSRFQHLNILGVAYNLTKDEKYAQEFVNQIDSWIKQNDYMRSVNWTCTMDVAIRAVNWINSYYLFKDSKSIDHRFWDRFNKSIFLHGDYIYKNLENISFYPNNHYISNIVGLIYIGLYFKNINDNKILRTARKWLRFGVKGIEAEIKNQVLDDGVNYERSTSYHCLVTEFFLSSAILLDKNNIELSNSFRNKLFKMCKFIYAISRNENIIPFVGDSDDGRLFRFSILYPYEKKDDVSYILGTAGMYFKNDEMKQSVQNNIYETMFYIGEWINPTAKERNQYSIAFKHGGYYVLKNKRVYCLIRCGTLSINGQGGHSHNDQLAYVLDIDGNEITIDAGTFSYSGDYQMRNYFRSTSSHNTVRIEGYEQNSFKPKDIFSMTEQTKSKCINFTNTEFKGEHYGYFDKVGAIHNRSIKLLEDGISITDHLSRKNILAQSNIILNKETSIQILNENEIELSTVDGLMYNIIHNARNVIISKNYISRSYGVKYLGKKLILEFSSELEYTIRRK
ncbi:MAG: alginate lyase family protein [Cytobacillus gottheilii]|uniref:alginate lyase family protein n=1 Tax=Cytobacillus gottheilii TaxID=859144 RepID=UPI0034640CA9